MTMDTAAFIPDTKSEISRRACFTVQTVWKQALIWIVQAILLELLQEFERAARCAPFRREPQQRGFPVWLGVTARGATFRSPALERRRNSMGIAALQCVWAWNSATSGMPVNSERLPFKRSSRASPKPWRSFQHEFPSFLKWNLRLCCCQSARGIVARNVGDESPHAERRTSLIL